MSKACCVRTRRVFRRHSLRSPILGWGGRHAGTSVSRRRGSLLPPARRGSEDNCSGAASSRRGRRRSRAFGWEETPGPPVALSVSSTAQAALPRCKLQAPAKLAQHHLPSAAIMIIYRDLISHDEMFSYIYKIREVVNGLYLEGEGTESTVNTGVDIVLNRHLQETSLTKETYKKYIKDYVKSIKGKLEEQRPETVKPFMTGASKQIKDILANFKNYQFFIGENMNPDGTQEIWAWDLAVKKAHILYPHLLYIRV
ncbi:hypothetical protein H8959_022480 [Pygathrix nigripes]